MIDPFSAHLFAKVGAKHVVTHSAFTPLFAKVGVVHATSFGHSYAGLGLHHANNALASYFHGTDGIKPIKFF